MGGSVGAVCLFVLSFGVLFLGVLAQAGNNNNPQGGGGGNQYGDRGQAGQGYNGQNFGGGPVNGENGGRNQAFNQAGNSQGSGPAGAEYRYRNGGPAAGQNMNGNGGPTAGLNRNGNNGPASGQYRNGGPASGQNRYGNRGPASGPGENPNRNGGGPFAAQIEFGNRGPANGNGYPNQNQGNDPAGQRGGENGGPSQYGGAQNGNRVPPAGQNEHQYGSGGQDSGRGGPGFGQDGGQTGNNPDSESNGISLSKLSPQLLARMVILGRGKSNMPTPMNMGVNLFEEEMPDPGTVVKSKTIQCKDCHAITSLPIYVESRGGRPIYIEEDEVQTDCEKVAPTSFSGVRDESRASLLGEYQRLTCGEKRAVGMAWRYEQMDPPPNDNDTKPEDLQFIRYLAIVCDEANACTPTLGNGSIWTGNDTDLPHNASMCVPGDHLSGIDITFKGPLIFDVRAKCCTSAIYPNCSMDYEQTLRLSHVGGTDLCDFCKKQLPTREELVFIDTEENQWYTRDYRAALHRLFLRLLVKRHVPIHNSSSEEQFMDAKILWKCPFNGTSLLPYDHLDFWVVGGKESNGCGLPVIQRVFLSEKHGIEYWSRTARAVMPNSNMAVVLLPQAIAWAKTDPCLEGC